MSKLPLGKLKQAAYSSLHPEPALVEPYKVRLSTYLSQGTVIYQEQF